MAGRGGVDRAALEPEWQRAFAWVEKTTGGKLVRAERQARWRPAWFLDVEKDGQILPLYWRGDRGLEGINSVYDCAYEATLYPILETHGVPVPHLYGLCRDPLGQLISRMPGRDNLASAGSEAERESVLLHYMEILARIHAIDAAEFERAGLARPPAGELALGDFALWVDEFRRTKRHPEPMLEFLIRWCRRNAPRGRQELTLVLSDAGQFLFDQGKVTAVLDLELAHLGDPLADLAALRTRTLSEPLGELAPAFRHYEQLSGRALDRDAIRFHSARFNLYTPLTTAHLVADPPPELDWALYKAWQITWGRASLEGVAELMGLELPAIQVPAPTPTSRAAPLGALVEMLAMADPGETEFQRYRRQRALRTAQALQSADRHAVDFEGRELREVAEILGSPPRSLREADLALEELVAAAGPERDADLVAYFHRRMQREHELHRSAMWELEDQRMQPI